MKLTFQVIDAFTTKPFEGNPACVILLKDGDLQDSLKQKIALEFNLSETAFLLPLEGSTSEAPKLQIRWFTPIDEAALCGHATLASAYVLFSSPEYSSAQSISFSSVFSGELIANKTVNNKISLSFPAVPTREASAQEKKDTIESVEQSAREFEGAVQDVKIGLIGGGEQEYAIVRLRRGTKLQDVQVSLQTITQVHSVVIITVENSDPSTNFHFFSRCFARGIGEDPVTGSAHAVLGPYWATHAKQYLVKPFEGKSFFARQVSPRGGNLEVVLDGERVHLLGNAVKVSKGEIEL